MAELTLGNTYRVYARIAADMAAATSDLGHRVSLLEMAQAWQRLANAQQVTLDDDKK